MGWGPLSPQSLWPTRLLFAGQRRQSSNSTDPTLIIGDAAQAAALKGAVDIIRLDRIVVTDVDVAARLVPARAPQSQAALLAHTGLFKLPGTDRDHIRVLELVGTIIGCSAVASRWDIERHLRSFHTTNTPVRDRCHENGPRPHTMGDCHQESATGSLHLNLLAGANVGWNRDLNLHHRALRGETLRVCSCFTATPTSTLVRTTSRSSCSNGIPGTPGHHGCTNHIHSTPVQAS